MPKPKFFNRFKPPIAIYLLLGLMIGSASPWILSLTGSGSAVAHLPYTLTVPQLVPPPKISPDRVQTLAAAPGDLPPPRRSTRPQDVWQEVYQKLPNLPRENQYVNRDTGKADPNNTLVSRLMRYHIYTKGRPAAYRLDWKLTIADYLGANEPIESTTYPSAASLQKNPLEPDMAVIAQLDRNQRNALVQALVDIFTPSAQPTPRPAVSPTPQLSPTPPTPPATGGARLLLP